MTRVLFLLGMLLATPVYRSNAADELRDPKTNQPPAPPLFSPSPVEYFRSLLKMNPSEREAALASRDAKSRASLLAKLNEYEEMPAAERDLKLRLVSLRYYLQRLMPMDATNRAVYVNSIPSPDRELVIDRLKVWDALPKETRQEYLENEATFHYLLRLRAANTPAERTGIIEGIPASRRPELERASLRWNSYSPETRARIYQNFNRFFELSDVDRNRTLGTLDATQRDTTRPVLQTFLKLSEEERARCMEGFRRFLSLSPGERDQFLRDAQKWQQMSSIERQAWGELVQKLHTVPPLPPGINGPPLPPGASPAAKPKSP